MQATKMYIKNTNMSTSDNRLLTFVTKIKISEIKMFYTILYIKKSVKR